MQPFHRELNQLLADSGKSLNRVAELSGVDRAYLSRLLSGEKRNPSQDVLIRLWIAIVFDEELLARHPHHAWGLERLALSLLWTNAPSRILSEPTQSTAKSISVG